MRIRSKTIFSNFSLRTTAEIETKKISYWLEKLFRQREKKSEDEKIEKIVAEQNPTSSNAYPEETKTTLQSQAGEQSEGEKIQAAEEMVNNSNRVLLRTSSVFPWDFFLSNIIIEDIRLTIIHRQLFASQVHSVEIKKISNIFIDTSILFSQIKIVSDTFAQNQIVISRLWKKEAILVRNVIEGLQTFINHDIDTTTYKTGELISKLQELNKTGIFL